MAQDVLGRPPHLELAQRPLVLHAEEDAIHVPLDRLIDYGVAGVASLEQFAADFKVQGVGHLLGPGQHLLALPGLRAEVGVKGQGPRYLYYVHRVNPPLVSLGQEAGQGQRLQASLGAIHRHQYVLDLDRTEVQTSVSFLPSLPAGRLPESSRYYIHARGPNQHRRTTMSPNHAHPEPVCPLLPRRGLNSASRLGKRNRRYRIAAPPTCPRSSEQGHYTAAP